MLLLLLLQGAHIFNNTRCRGKYCASAVTLMARNLSLAYCVRCVIFFLRASKTVCAGVSNMCDRIKYIDRYEWRMTARGSEWDRIKWGMGGYAWWMIMMRWCGHCDIGLSFAHAATMWKCVNPGLETQACVVGWFTHVVLSEIVCVFRFVCFFLLRDGK